MRIGRAKAQFSCGKVEPVPGKPVAVFRLVVNVDEREGREGQTQFSFGKVESVPGSGNHLARLDLYLVSHMFFQDKILQI
jgi:hypothetical protein